ncbi:hypothetical protein RHMOL_Rhmol01G0202300 [Rhododendron molle]|uniref:Uncharacterized protein n=1 Tax=Rhododendron molle TaxID=49168 RepID=A0ACC0Q4U7_RHOML|nr:hypothetical protein RHMOL_Rhmol01G0202300 [Rhododendron molle]
MESSSTSSAESYASVDPNTPGFGEIDPRIAEAIRTAAREYRVQGGRPLPKAFEGVFIPTNVTLLRSIGPDIINLDDEPSDKAAEDPDEEADAEGEDEEVIEEEAKDEETPVVSSSRAEGETGIADASSSQAPKKKKRKIVALDPDEIPVRTGRDPCPYWDCFTDQEGIDLFRTTYHIPNDVIISTIPRPRIRFSDEHITVPLMAITEGGLRFPMHRILREILHYFELTPCQLSVNSYRIIHLIIKLAEIIPEGMYDSEKWASDYVEVRGNYQFRPSEDDQFYVAKERGNPNTTKINKNLLRLAKDCGLTDSLLTILRAERDAQTILQYDATYGGRIRGKGAEGSEKTKSTTVDLTDLPKEQLPNPNKLLRGTVRQPTEGASGSAPKPSAQSKKATPDAVPQKRPPSPLTSSDKPAKRYKVTAKKSSAAAGKTPRGEEQEGKGSENEAHEADVAWAPSFITPHNKQILRSDSLIEDPSLAFTLHAGLRLPRDFGAQGSLKTALSDYYYFTSKGLQDEAEQARVDGKDEGLAEGRALGRKEMEEEIKKEQ